MDPQKPRRHWFRFRLRTLLIVVMVFSIPFGWRGLQIRKEKAAIAWVEELGGEINYHYRQNTSWWEKTTNMWLGKKEAERAYLHYTRVTDVSPLTELKDLKLIVLTSTDVSDVSPLAKLKNLKQIDLTNTQVSNEQVKSSKQALPNCRINHNPEPLIFWAKLLEDFRIRLNRKEEGS